MGILTRWPLLGLAALTLMAAEHQLQSEDTAYPEKQIIQPGTDDMASGALSDPHKVWYLNGIDGTWLAVGQPNTLNRRDRVVFRFPISHLVPTGEIKNAVLVFKYSSGGKQKRNNIIQIEHFNVERIKLSGNDLISNAVEPVTQFAVLPEVRNKKITFDVSEKINSDIISGFGFSTFRIKSITADELGNIAMESSYVTVKNNSIKLFIEP